MTEIHDISHWQSKIVERRKESSFQDFLRDIVSWHPLILHRNGGHISRFPESPRSQVQKNEDFHNNRDELTKKGRIYNENLCFFKNFEKLFSQIHLPNMFHYQKNENSDFTDTAVDTKNTYLSNTIVLYSENVFYSFMVRGECKNVLNSLYISSNSEHIYFSRGVIKGYKVYYSGYINNSSNIWFSSNLTGCSECILCDNLENKSFYIENIKFNKHEYFKRKEEILREKNNFLDWYKTTETQGKNHNSSEISGNYIVESENVENGSYVFNTKDAKNVMFIGATSGNTNFCDVFAVGGSGRTDIYGVQSTGGSDQVYCSACIGYSSSIYYSYFLESCSFCLGCVGLKNKSYCILNTQYTKEQWYTITNQIFSKMDKQGTLGEFFPGGINPFYFNDTVAGLIGNFTKEEVKAKGYMWREGKIGVDIPQDLDVIQVDELGKYQGYNMQGDWDIDPLILKKVIQDKNGNYYRIVQMEYDFLMKHSLPLPEIHWLERMELNLQFS